MTFKIVIANGVNLGFDVSASNKKNRTKDWPIKEPALASVACQQAVIRDNEHLITWYRIPSGG